MRRALTVAVLLALLGRPAAAWSEDAGEWEPEPPEIEVPVREVEVFAREVEAPVREIEVQEPPEVEVPVREIEVPAREVEVLVREVEVLVREERLAEREIPEGVYLVTETYVRDVVTIEGPLTTYETETVAWSPGSYARELETVGTGTASELDGAAFNGRLALSDGRPVAGTFYENFVWTSDGLVPVSVVFFQDDAELRRVASLPAAPEPAAAPAEPAPPSTLAAVPAPAPASTEAGGDGSVPASEGPLLDERDAPAPAAAATPSAPAATGAPPGAVAPSPPFGPFAPVAPSAPITPRPVGGSVATTQGGAAAQRVEVLRGRRVALWPRASSDGSSATVLAWRLVSGEATAVTAAGSGADPFVARWDRLAPPGSSYVLRFALQVAVPGEVPPPEVEASIEVAVLSPALDR